MTIVARLDLSYNYFMKIVVFSGGNVVDSKLVREAINEADAILAADSGADSALKLGIYPDVVLGDFDSLSSQSKKILEQKKIQQIRVSAEKDETDTELAIMHANQLGATEIVVIGGTYGERIDHVMANMLYAAISSVPIYFINGLQKSFIMNGPNTVRLHGHKKDLLSLIPLTEDVKGLVSEGLKWQLHNDTLLFGKPRGISNVFTKDTVSISWISGNLFISQTAQK